MYRPNVVAGITTTLFAAALIALLLFSNTNEDLKTNLSKEKLSYEKLLAEKLLLNKEVVQYNKEIDQLTLEMNNLRGKNSDLDRMLASSQKSLSQKQIELNRLAKSNAGKKAIENKFGELRRIIDNYETQVASFNDRISSLISEQNSLIDENASLKEKLAILEAKNKNLLEDNQKLVGSVADNYLLFGLKGKKDKLTLIAKKTDKLVLDFEVPEDMVLDLTFSIIGPDGKRNSIETKNITTKTVEQGLNSFDSDVQPNSKRMRMEYSPAEKLSSGLYKIEIFNGDKQLGSCRIRLK